MTESTLNTPCGFIDDGYTLDFHIPEVPGVSVGLRGKRRPLTNRALIKLLESCRQETYTAAKPAGQGLSVTQADDKIDEARAQGVAKQLVEWDLVDSQGNPVPITAVNVSRLHPPRLLGELMDVICGTYTAVTRDTRILDVVYDPALDLDAKLTAIRTILESGPTAVASKPLGSEEANDLKN